METTNEVESEEELSLTFRVPNTDFDFIRVELGIKAIEEELSKVCAPGFEFRSLYCAYQVLWTVLDRYADAVGSPDFKRPFIEYNEFENRRFQAWMASQR